MIEFRFYYFIMKVKEEIKIVYFVQYCELTFNVNTSTNNFVLKLCFITILIFKTYDVQ